MRWWLALALAACTDDKPIVTPVIDMPTNAPASPFPLDSITVAVAHQGEPLDLISVTFQRGELVELDSVPYADDLVIHMTGYATGQEYAYGRTCPFEVRPDGRLPEPHLYFSRGRLFGTLAPRPISREHGIAITFSDGSGLVLGGTVPGDTQGIVQVERFDTSGGEYLTLHDILPRRGAAAALLGDPSDARVVVVGGLDANGAGATFVEVIDADRFTDRQYEQFDDARMAREGLTATTLGDGRVVVIGGIGPNQPPSGKVALLELASGTALVNEIVDQLVVPRHGHTATRLGDDRSAPVLVAGGLDATGMPVGPAELFKPSGNRFSPDFMETMNIPRSRHQARRLPDGSVLIIGGVNALGETIDQLELFSLESGFRTATAGKLPPNAGLIDFTATQLPDGRILLTGGRLSVGGAPITSVFIASVNANTGMLDISSTDRLAHARAGHQATVLCDGTVLISGGTSDQTPYERYNPSTIGRR
jgi:hypothetical protein